MRFADIKINTLYSVSRDDEKVFVYTKEKFKDDVLTILLRLDSAGENYINMNKKLTRDSIESNYFIFHRLNKSNNYKGFFKGIFDNIEIIHEI